MLATATAGEEKAAAAEKENDAVLEEHATSPTAADGVGDVERAGNATFVTKRTGRGLRDSEVVHAQKIQGCCDCGR